MFRIENYSHESERRGENGKKAKDKKGYLTRREVALVHIAVTTNFFSEMMFKNIGVEYLTRGGGAVAYCTDHHTDCAQIQHCAVN